MQNPDLYGGDSMEWGDFLELFESIADWNDWTERDKAVQLRMSLQGPALKVLWTFPPQIKGNYKHLCEAMQSAFASPEQVLMHKAAFKAGPGIPGRLRVSFSCVLHALAAKAYLLKKLPEIDEILQDQFVEGLGDNRVQEHILLRHTGTFNQTHGRNLSLFSSRG